MKLRIANTKPSIRLTLTALVLCVAAAASSTWAQHANTGANPKAPPELEEVGITENLGDFVPLTTPLMDELGNPVKFGDYFDGERPVVLALVYYDCPMLCNLVLEGLLTSMKSMPFDPGDEYRVVTLSFSHFERHTRLAKAKKQTYLRQLGRPGAENGWHFLTGSQGAILDITEAVGFEFEYLKDRQEFAHQAAIFVLSPEGKITRYLYGVRYDPETLRLSLVEAAEGKVGTTLDKIVLTCFKFNALEGRYTPTAMGIMRLGGVLTVIALGITLTIFWRRERKRSLKYASTQS